MLTLEELLIETDSDLPIVATVIIGFENEGDLMLVYESMNYDTPSESHIKYALVEKQEVYTLAKKMHIPLIQLPVYIAKKYGVQPFCQAVPSEALALFKEILNYFASYGIKYQYKTKRKW